MWSYNLLQGKNIIARVKVLPGQMTKHSKQQKHGMLDGQFRIETESLPKPAVSLEKT